MDIIRTELVDGLLKRRSIRSYTDEQLSSREIETIVQCGLWAPSGRNNQTTFFSVVTDRQLLKQLQAELMENTDNPSKWMSGSFYYNAPCVIFMFGKDGDRWSQINGAIAAENMHIAAHSLGLGSIILGIIKDFMLSDKGEKWKEILKVPEGYSFVLALAAGYIDKDSKPLPRNEGNVVYITEDNA